VLTDRPTSEDLPESDDDEVPEARRKLSVLRVVLAVVLVAAGAAIVGRGFVRATAKTPPAVKTAAPWFAPYVDTTLTPYYQFQDPAQNPSRQVILGFVVSDSKAACTPSWGGYFTEQQAAETLSLDRRVAQLQAEGGTAIASFGGQANGELALGCDDQAQLEGAYQSVITRYHLTTVDFDMEGSALLDAPSIARRAQAIASLQRVAHASGHDLSVWLTLPVLGDGLQPDALSLLSETLRAGVDLTGINVMTMDFGKPEPDLAATVKQALSASHDQLESIYRDRGEPLSSLGAWNKIGATVMIGQNDTDGEVFTTADAKALVAFAAMTRLGRMSIWSLNRDNQCGAAAFVDVNVHSNTCSGTRQTALEFTSILSSLPGTSADGDAMSTSSSVLASDPANSPYPLWSPAASYVEGYRVVRNRFVYQSKWYTKGVDPIASNGTDVSPWQLVGPVLPTDRAPTTTTLPVDAFPAWLPTTAYSAGAKVLVNGLPYQAKWYNQGTDPAASIDQSASPWQPLFTVPGEPAPTS
jgi:chitinase